MQLSKTTKQIRCNVLGCFNLAEYNMALKKSFLNSGAMYFCKNCLNQMYSSIGKVVIPQSVKSVYKKNSKVDGDKDAKK